MSFIYYLLSFYLLVLFRYGHSLFSRDSCRLLLVTYSLVCHSSIDAITTRTHQPSNIPCLSDVINASIGDDEGGLFLRHQRTVEDLRNPLLALAFLQHDPGG